MSFPDLPRRSTAVLFAVIGLTVAGFSGRILDMINASPEFYVIYRLSPLQVVLIVALFAFVLPVALGALGWLFARIRPLNILALALLFALLTFVISGAARALSDPTGGWLVVVGSVVLAGVICWAFVKFDVVRFVLAATALYLPILLYQSILAAGLDIDDLISGKEQVAQAPSAKDSSLPNVLFIVLDEFPVTTILGRDGLIDGVRFPNLRALADTSNWFRQASTVSCNTPTAVPAIQSGKLFGSPPESILPLVQYYPQNVFTLLWKSYHVEATETLTQLCPDYLCGKVEKTSTAYSPLVKHLGVAWLHASFPKQMETKWPDLDTYWMNAAATQDAPPEARRDRYSARFDQIDQFNEAIGKLPQPWLKFGHFLMPHTPFQSTGAGEVYYPGKTTWAINGRVWSEQAEHVHQSYARHIEQARFTDRVIGRLVDTLQSTGQYDNTLIALVADHGVSFVPGDARRTTNVRNFPNLIGVPMLIKEPDQKAGRMIDDAVQTVDMVPTILGQIKIDAGNTNFDGRDVLLPNPKTITERLHYCNRRDYYRFPVDLLPHLMEQVKIRDGLFGTRPDGELEFLFAPHKEWLGQNLSKLGSVEQSNGIATIDGLTDGVPPINLDGTVEGIADVGGVYIVATVNGKIASVMPLVEDGKKNNVISSFLLPRLLAGAADVIELYVTEIDKTPVVFRKMKIVDSARKKNVDELSFAVDR